MADRLWLKNYPEGVVWDQTFEPFPVAEILDRAVEEFPDHVHLDFMDYALTYAQVGELVARAARGFQKLGVKKGTKVGIFLPNCPQFVIAYFGILKAGGVVVNFSPLYSESELLQQVSDSETDFMVTLNAAALLRRIEPVLHQTRLKKLIVADICDMVGLYHKLRLSLFARKHFLPVREDESHLAFRSLLRNDGDYEPVAVDPEEDIAVLQYTGGTTGLPKGAMLTHANLSINVQQSQVWDPDTKRGEGRVLVVLPLFHAFAMTGILLLATSIGFRLVLTPKFEPEEALNLILKHRITHFPGVPTMYTAILNHPDIDKADLSFLERCNSGGAPLPLELKAHMEEKLDGVQVREGYGLTETSPVAIVNPVSGLSKPGSVGLPAPGTDVCFTDPDDPAKVLEYGERGEIRIRGPQVMKGYWKRPEATAEAIIDGWLRTGDVGYMDEDGYTFIVDRLKDMIIVGGFNVYPRTIEEAIYEHPSVREVTVIGVADDYLGERPKAFVVLREDARGLSADKLKSFLLDRLGKHEMPREIEFRDELPKTMVGKLSKKELAAEEEAKYQGAEQDS
ncbi:MAG: long-chain fatty acid--CoA ligase [Proteobacteria bacterium]|nr:long-chain fatty acid--CoA ligase [Pseudomonadota bacterium]